MSPESPGFHHPGTGGENQNRKDGEVMRKEKCKKCNGLGTRKRSRIECDLCLGSGLELTPVVTDSPLGRAKQPIQRHPDFPSGKERAESIIKDILTNHLPRVQEGLKKGYVDENQILVIYDHAVRARILIEHEL